MEPHLMTLIKLRDQNVRINMNLMILDAFHQKKSFIIARNRVDPFEITTWYFQRNDIPNQNTHQNIDWTSNHLNKICPFQKQSIEFQLKCCVNVINQKWREKNWRPQIHFWWIVWFSLFEIFTTALHHGMVQVFILLFIVCRLYILRAPSNNQFMTDKYSLRTIGEKNKKAKEKEKCSRT